MSDDLVVEGTAGVPRSPARRFSLSVPVKLISRLDPRHMEEGDDELNDWWGLLAPIALEMGDLSGATWFHREPRLCRADGPTFQTLVERLKEKFPDVCG